LGLGGTGAGQWDVVNVTGTASLGGTLAVTLYSGYAPQVGDNLLVLSASSISGRFSQLNNPQGVRWYPQYQNTNLSLLAIQPTFQVTGLTSNQAAVAAWLDKNYMDPALNGIVPSVGIHASSALGADFDLIAPTALTPLFKMGFATADSQAFLVERRLNGLAGDGGNSASAFASQMGNEPLYAQAATPARTDASSGPAERNWDVFVEGTGNLATIKGDANAAGYQYSLAGVSGGADYLVSPQIKAGLLLGFSQGSATGTGSKVDVSGGTAGLFAGWRQEGLHAEAMASGALNQYTTQRAGYGGSATGTSQGQQISGYLNLGYDWRMKDSVVGGFLSGHFSNTAINAFKETGSSAPLSIPAQNETYMSGEVGVRYSPTLKMGDSTLSPFLSAAWEQIFQGYQDSLGAGLGSAGGFSVTGPATGQGAVVLQGGANARISNSFSLYAEYQGKLGMSNFTSHNFSGGMNFGF
jgi:outer membrane autotransporter protein